VHLSSKQKDLSSNPNTEKKRKILTQSELPHKWGNSTPSPASSAQQLEVWMTQASSQAHSKVVPSVLILQPLAWYHPVF
jgi:hypothetical protein